MAFWINRKKRLAFKCQVAFVKDRSSGLDVIDSDLRSISVDIPENWDSGDLDIPREVKHSELSWAVPHDLQIFNADYHRSLDAGSFNFLEAKEIKFDNPSPDDKPEIFHYPTDDGDESAFW